MFRQSMAKTTLAIQSKPAAEVINDAQQTIVTQPAKNICKEGTRNDTLMVWEITSKRTIASAWKKIQRLSKYFAIESNFSDDHNSDESDGRAFARY